MFYIKDSFSMIWLIYQRNIFKCSQLFDGLSIFLYQESESYATYVTLIVQIAILAISRQTATVEITVLHLRNFHLGEATGITAPW